MKALISALQFITILPVGKAKTFEPSEMVPYFPIVGLIIGCIVAGADRLFLLFWSLPIASLLDVLVLAALTGAFHLDGLGDTADGLYGHRSREDALRIMKDSRIGAMGLIAIISILALKWGGLSGLEGSQRSLLIIIIPAYARTGILFGMKMLPYGRPEGGTGKPFFQEHFPAGSFWGALPALVLSLLLGWRCVLINLAFIGIAFGVIAYYKKKINGITGDMLGAMVEVIEAGLFLLLSIGGLL
jgi:adenosylcobinamide-GDP ribazoletransferase